MISGLGLVCTIPRFGCIVAIQMLILPALDFPVDGGNMYPELVRYFLFVYLLAEHDLKTEPLFIR